MSKFLNISTDNTLGGNNASNDVVSSQKAVKDFVDNRKDNLSITNNANNQLQTVGVINQNAPTTALKQWSGTLAQYNAIATKDANTLYNITDDTDFTLTLLETLYPVGSIYITTASTCPLSTLISGSTWELVSSGRVLQGADSGHNAGTTVEAGLPNITGEIATSVPASYEKVKTGAVYNRTFGSSSSLGMTGGSGVNSTAGTVYGFGVNASLSSSIYGNSTTVQPPAYFVNIYRRTA